MHLNDRHEFERNLEDVIYLGELLNSEIDMCLYEYPLDKNLQGRPLEDVKKIACIARNLFRTLHIMKLDNDSKIRLENIPSVEETTEPAPVEMPEFSTIEDFVEAGPTSESSSELNDDESFLVTYLDIFFCRLGKTEDDVSEVLQAIKKMQITLDEFVKKFKTE